MASDPKKKRGRPTAEALEKALAEPMSQLRGEAIDAYSQLEYTLARLLSVLGDMPLAVAMLIFFKMPANTRRVVLDKLKARKLKDEYSEFWKTAIKTLRTLDDARNNIVHWHLLVHIDGPEAAQVLKQPSSLFGGDPPKQLKAQDLIDFRAKAQFVDQVLSNFSVMIRWPNKLPPAWRDIYQQRVAYPPPDSHPIFRNDIEPPDQPPPSGP